MAKDADYIKLIHTTQWLNLRHQVLSEHPLCQRCEDEGYITAAVEVHHRRPVEHGLTFKDKERLMFDRGNLVALCHACHVAVHKEIGRSGKVATRRLNDEKMKEIIGKFFGD